MKDKNIDKVSPIAQNVIDICGGIIQVSKWAGCTPKTVYCWTYPKSRGGTGGRIPIKYQDKIIARARKSKIPLAMAHFYEEKVDAPDA